MGEQTVKWPRLKLEKDEDDQDMQMSVGSDEN